MNASNSNGLKSKAIEDMLDSSIFHNSMNLVKDMMAGYDPSHDFFHVKRVLKLAIHIYESEFINDQSVDVEVLILSAIFHDAADFKYSDNVSKEQILKNLCTFLKNNSLPESKIGKIIYIIENISYRKELECKDILMSKELMIVRDSDRLEALGAIGIARCFGYTCITKRPFYDPKIQPLENITAEEYNKQESAKTSTAYTHFFEKLFKLKDRMCTETGKMIAAKRHQFMVDFISQFEDEILLNDKINFNE